MILAVFILIGAAAAASIFNRLTFREPVLKGIVILTAFMIFLRPLIGEGYFLESKLVFRALILALCLAYVFAQKQSLGVVSRTSPSQPLSWFMVGVLASSFFSVNLESSIQSLIFFLCLFAWMFLIADLARNIEIAIILENSLVLSLIVVMLYCFEQYFFGFKAMREFVAANPEYFNKSPEFIRRLNSNIIYGTFTYPPALAGFLNLAGFAAIAIIAQRTAGKLNNIWVRIFPVLIMLLGVILLVMTKAKAAWIAFFLGVLLMFQFSREKKKSLYLIFAAGLIFSAVFCYFKFTKSINMPEPANFVKSANVRIEYWKAGISMIKSRPVMGFGPGTFANVYPRFKTLIGEESITPHNSYLQIACESGLLSLAIFLIAIFFLFRTLFSAIKIGNLHPAIAAGLGTFFVHNFFDFSLFSDQTALIAATVAGIALSRASLEDRKLKDQEKARSLILLILGLAFFINISFYSAALFRDHALKTTLKQESTQAIANYKRAIFLNPLSADYRAELGELYLEKSRRSMGESRANFLQQAVRLSLEAIMLDPFRPFLHLQLAKIIFAGSADIRSDPLRRGIILHHLNTAVNLYPNNPLYHDELAKFYDIIGSYGMAESRHNTAERLRPYYKKGTW